MLQQDEEGWSDADIRMPVKEKDEAANKGTSTSCFKTWIQIV